MNRLRKWTLLTAVAGGTLFAGCTADIRDAMLAGIFDYIIDTTAGLVSVISPLDDVAAQE